MAQAKRIAALSVEASDLDRIKQLLEQAKGRLPRSWQWSVETEAEALLIDVDSVYGHMDWLRAQSGPRRIISLSSRSGSEHEITLTRPITLEGVARAFSRLDQSESHASEAPTPAPTRAPTPAPVAARRESPISAAVRPVSTVQSGSATAPMRAASPVIAAVANSAPAPAVVAAPVTAPMPAPVPTTVAAPQQLVLADFCSADTLPLPARLVRGDLPSLTVDAAADCYYGPTALKPLIAYCQGTVARDEWEPVSSAVLQGLRDAGAGQSLSRLLWLYTLTNSNGQLMPGLDLNARYKLPKWPQIEREFPKHFRIATVMMRGPATLTDLAEQSGAALPDVVDFINAYIVTGFAEMEGAPPTANLDASGAGSLLSRLRARVRRG